MEVLKLFAFLCVSSCCAFVYTVVEYKTACRQKKRRKQGMLVLVGIISVFSLMATSLPLAYYALCIL